MHPRGKRQFFIFRQLKGLTIKALCLEDSSEEIILAAFKEHSLKIWAEIKDQS